MKDKILDELDFDTVSFRDGDGDWFIGIENSDFVDVSARIVNLFDIYYVSKNVAYEYAKFCVECDRNELPLLCLEDYIKQYCS